MRISATHFAHVAFRARGRCFFRDFDSQRVVTQLSANSMEHIYTNALKKMHQNARIGDRQEGKAAPAAAAFRSCRPIIFINTVFRHLQIYCHNVAKVGKIKIFA